MHANYKFSSLSANFKLTTKFGVAESGQKLKAILTLYNTYNGLTLIIIGHPSIDSIQFTYLSYMEHVSKYFKTRNDFPVTGRFSMVRKTVANKG